ncbi:hypothetical protein KKY53_14725 [Pseudomonas aeruginosa]|uniref:hypothetical protein n=1 Tax=Pseudomonas aeruginosa TaxID=287 RepID=UPI002293C186|nr:hypothetical protein KKY53_14725 [Pseudomonas aeruginosa]HBO0862817.1 hypothetical protein [Pseudomonas aeruginosa]HBO5217619.1 hypothetical protein [Pseudomonas aeruginosa]HCE6882105.1 hypothetical protein [Pseudomonas aeruginosa]HCE9349172.1 hypothetical protein [Pseudomonas aeruginosa]
MSIDWSKAPEGANKAGFTGHDNYLQFYRIPGMFGDYDFWSEKRGWCGNDFPTCANHLFERPAKVEWDGQGLPPVGTVCEYRHMIWPEYRPCEIRYISEESLVAYDDAQEQFYRTCDMLFRPVRSPEQIAAAERWAAIQQMLAFADVKYGAGELMSPKEYVETAVAALYDAGYRRQEEGK